MKPNWLELPREVTANIFQRLGVIEIVTSACQVCPLWWNICKDPFMWRTIDMGKIEVSHYKYDLKKICRYVVERSCGHLEDINIEHFCTDDLLHCIADSTSQLPRLRLADCWDVSDKGMWEVAKKLPLLEELDISYFYLSKDTFEAIGQCCPLLKVLKFCSSMWCRTELDDVALAIAKTMSKLRHLQIYGNNLSDVGMTAILDGCPLLQYLDVLRYIYFVTWI
ncbi:Leucine-rich repeat, cysteine-containing subtype [Sesbania bispinosa]|nr:Leucine-rich repeat, cysteine-containing subtype [Sesbania bispinosa]